MENEMDTVLKRALHYVQCYTMHWPTSGASDVAEELRQEIADAMENQPELGGKHISDLSEEQMQRWAELFEPLSLEEQAALGFPHRTIVEAILKE